MKRTILNLLVLLFLASFSSKAIPNVEMGWNNQGGNPCISYTPGIGWFVQLNYNTWGGGGNFNFWAYYQGVAYGPTLGYNSTANSVLFILPSQLYPFLEKGECVDIAYNWLPSNQTAPSVYQQAAEEFYQDPLTLGYFPTKMCPCPENNFNDNCIGHFTYQLNTADLINSNAIVTLNDNDISHLLPTITNQLNQVTTPCEGAKVNGPNGCVGIGTKKIKTTDTWDITFSWGTNIIIYNSIDNPGMYDANGINLLPIYAIGFGENYTEVCHKKTVEIGCYYKYGNIHHNSSDCSQYNDFYPYKTMYECEVCQHICIDPPYIKDGLINSDETTSDVSAKKSFPTNFNFISIYPNPASNALNVSFTEKASELIELKITDIQGKVIKKSNYTSKEGQNLIEVNIDNVANGMYFLQISSPTNKFTEKFTIKK